MLNDLKGLLCLDMLFKISASEVALIWNIPCARRISLSGELFSKDPRTACPISQLTLKTGFRSEMSKFWWGNTIHLQRKTIQSQLKWMEWATRHPPNISRWKHELRYEGGIFSAVLNFPGDFPNNPPEMKLSPQWLRSWMLPSCHRYQLCRLLQIAAPRRVRFETEMWHPNIYPDGRVCISILHPPGTDRFNDQAKPWWEVSAGAARLTQVLICFPSGNRWRAVATYPGSSQHFDQCATLRCPLKLVDLKNVHLDSGYIIVDSSRFCFLRWLFHGLLMSAGCL